MKFRHFLWLFLLLPCLGFAAAADQSAISFNPPESDFSVVLLSHIFGVVGNMLHGTGSQIMGEVFRVFNAAVLTIGGILLFYILIVSTLNTSAEGEYLGKKWKSIWIPIRAVIGIVLLVPQQSGYCLAQLFVMWLVLQGVGAGDAVWNTSLDYLARGGVIAAPNLSFGEKAPESDKKALQGVANVAGQVLENTVCMKILQSGAETARDFIKNAGGVDPGRVPDLQGSINFLAIEKNYVDKNDSTTKRSIDFPNIDFWGIPAFKGFCGSVSWDPVNLGNAGTNPNMTEGTRIGALTSRAEALDAMFTSVSSTANTIFNALTTGKELGRWDGNNWILGNTQLSGLEGYAASLSYLAYMRDTLNMISRSITPDLDFMKQARTYGWIMAGSYFHNIAALKREEVNLTTEVGKVTVNPPGITQTDALLQAISEKLPNGVSIEALKQRDKILFYAAGIISSQDKMDYKTACSDVSNPDKQLLCYIVSAKNIIAAIGGPDKQKFNFKPFDAMKNNNINGIPERECDGGFFTGCAGAILYNNIIVKPINGVIVAPLNSAWQGFSTKIFSTGNAFDGIFNSIYKLFNSANNPIISLAKAGDQLIFDAGIMWLVGLGAAAILGVIPTNFGATVLSFIMPLYTLIFSTLLGAGIILAYYIPLVPYITYTFASIGWVIAVIESMVAAPIVALGIAHPENHEVFGKAEQAVMLLLNVFLRPAMTVIGFVTAIILSYVSIWLLNEGFIRVAQETINTNLTGFGWLFAPLAAIAIYVTILMVVVQKAFALIYMLPDKILRWLSGGTQASFGEEAAGMVSEVKGTVSKGAEGAAQGVGQFAGKTLEGAHAGAKAAKDALKGAMEKGPEHKEEAEGGKDKGGEEAAIKQGIQVAAGAPPTG